MSRDRAALEREVEALGELLRKQRRINSVLMRQVEHSADTQGSAFTLFRTAVTLEERVRERTAELGRMLDTLQKTNNELSIARERADAGNRAKSEFLANMSHEIRTPLGGVLGAATLLKDTPLNSEQQELLQAISSSGEVLLTLINDILDLSKIESGRMTVELIRVDVRAIVKSAIDIFALHAREKGIGLESTVSERIPQFVLSDPVRLRQILTNLLGNAFKFTAEGRISVAVELRDGPSELLFSVSDTGIGIPPDIQAKLFQPFTQGDASTTRRFGGTGLGLTICKRLAELLGGNSGVDSQPGSGSMFWFSVTAQVVEASAVDEVIDPAADFRCAARILVVEDNTVNRLIARGYLEKLGAVVESAVDGLEAVAAVSTGTYDLVFMDCQMPEMDGYEATRVIRAKGGAFADLPVIALTASALTEDKKQCLDAGMSDYLTKPIRLPELIAVLERWLNTVP